MVAYLFANRATSVLTRAINSTDTVLRINVTDSSKFPVPSAQSLLQLAVTDTTGKTEYMAATNRVGEDITVIRAREGTPASAFPIGSRVELRITATVLRNFLQISGGAMDGDIDMNNKTINNVTLGVTRASLGMNIGVLAALDNNQARALRLPNGGASPQIGPYDIITAEYMHLLVFAAWMQPANIPIFLKLCDGTNNTPDLRNRFILGTVPGEFPTGTSGGGFEGVTDPGGSHSHGGQTQPVFLQNGNMPNLNPITSTKVFVQPAGGEPGAIQATRDVIVPGINAEYLNAVPHAHALFTEADHRHGHRIVPPYVALCYVMFRYTFPGAT